MRGKNRVSSKEAAIEGTKRVCDRTAGKEKCEDIYNNFKYGHGDMDRYFEDMDGAIRHGRKRRPSTKAKKPKRKKKVKVKDD